ncbi:hypothetical protein LCGC14_1741860 [marine sediment metagenome]|uniref:Uncharacterized protein n=1 Tax=marine sediment metagenome TaxID=412755 RepID=A0A0F9H6G0_9ZZZZ
MDHWAMLKRKAPTKTTEPLIERLALIPLAVVGLVTVLGLLLL